MKSDPSEFNKIGTFNEKLRSRGYSTYDDPGEFNTHVNFAMDSYYDGSTTKVLSKIGSRDLQYALMSTR
jgi:hypothetical protein